MIDRRLRRENGFDLLRAFGQSDSRGTSQAIEGGIRDEQFPHGAT